MGDIQTEKPAAPTKTQSMDAGESVAFALLRENDTPIHEPKTARPRLQPDQETESVQEEALDLGEPNARTPRTRAGGIINTLDTRGRLTDEQIGRMLNRDDGTKWTKRTKVALRIGAYLGIGTGVFFGARAALEAKRKAIEIGTQVQEIQERRGNFAIDSGSDPTNAPIPEVQEPRPEQEKAGNKSQSKGKGR